MACGNSATMCYQVLPYASQYQGGILNALFFERKLEVDKNMIVNDKTTNEMMLDKLTSLLAPMFRHTFDSHPQLLGSRSVNTGHFTEAQDAVLGYPPGYGCAGPKQKLHSGLGATAIGLLLDCPRLSMQVK